MKEVLATESKNENQSLLPKWQEISTISDETHGITKKQKTKKNGVACTRPSTDPYLAIFFSKPEISLGNKALCVIACKNKIKRQTQDLQNHASK